jgi:hypothetical protein
MRILRPWRRLRAYATAFLLGAAVLLVAGWSALPVLVERRLLEDLKGAGIVAASLNVAAVGLHETRIADIRLGAAGDVTAAEIVASYDLRHFLRAQPERLVIRGLRVSARLDSHGLSLEGVTPASRNGERGILNGALLRAVPPVAIESGKVEIATPIGPLALPFEGTMSPLPDGGIEAAIDLQAESAHGRFGGALKLAATDSSIAADLTIAGGRAAIGPTLSTAFTGRAKVRWAKEYPPQVSADFELKEASIAGAAFPAGSLTVEMGGAQWTAQLALMQRDGSSDLRTKVVVAEPYGNPRLGVSSNLTAAVGAWLWPLLGLPQPQRGSVRFALRLDGPLPDGGLLDRSIATPGDVIRLLADGEIDGSVDITADAIALPDLATVNSAIGRWDIHASGGTLSIAQKSELRASGTIAPARLAGLGLAPELSTLLAGPLNASVALPQPLRFVSGNAKTTAVGEFSANLASASGATLDVCANGQAVLSSDLTISEFAVADGLAAIGGIALPFARSTRFEVGGSIAGKPGQFDGRLHATGALSDLTTAGLNAASIDVNFDAAIVDAGDRIAVRLVDDGVAVARQVSGTDLVGAMKEVAIPLVQGEEPMIAFDLSDPAAPRAAYDLRLGAIKTNASLLLGGPKPLPVSVTLPALRWVGRWSGADGDNGTIQLADASLAFPSLGAKANGVRATATIAGDKWSADLGVARIEHSAKQPLIVPLSLTGKIDAADDRLSFTGVLSDSAKRLRSTIEVEHSFAANKGRATLKTSLLTFAPGGLQPRDLVPAISPQIEEVTGSAAIGGRIAWSGGKVTSDLKLLLQDLSFKLPQADVVRINTVVNIDSLVPFTTLPSQQLAAGIVDVGLPLSDLVATFRIEPGPQLVIENARLSLTGGAVTMPAVGIDLADPRADLVLSVEDVDLAALLQLAQIDGLTGTGSLSGRIPVSIAGDAVVIHDATLAASGAGSLRYAPAMTPSALVGAGANMDMALQALNNFQYTVLTLTVNRESGGETVALMHVKGRNPDFYGGYPVELNLNISGKLDQILDRSLAGYRIPENIRKNLGEFAQ